jgi:branched-chain amino acid transport system permease protein
MTRYLRGSAELLGPVVLVALVGLVGANAASAANAIEIRTVLVDVAIVVSLYVFVGNSGVLSFGQVSFVAVGAFSAGLMTVPTIVKPSVLPDLFPFLKDHSIGNFESLVLATVIGAAYALVVGIPLMRLSGLAAGIATLSVLGLTYNILTYWPRIGPGATALSLIPTTTSFVQATLGTIGVAVVAFIYQRSRLGRQLRATRDDPAVAEAAGIDVHRQRLWAFTLSGALSGFSGGLFCHLTGTLTTNQLYLELTFLTLAMLVVGGIGSLFGAVVGALAIGFLTIALQNGENTVHVLGRRVTLPAGSSLIGVALVMLAVVLLRPSGITGGREFRISLGRRRGRLAEPTSPSASQSR